MNTQANLFDVASAFSDDPSYPNPSDQTGVSRPAEVIDRADAVPEYRPTRAFSWMDVPPFEPKLQALLDAAARTARLLGAPATDISHFMSVAAADQSAQQLLANMGLNDVRSLAERILVHIGRETATTILTTIPSDAEPPYAPRLSSALLIAAAGAKAQERSCTRLSDALYASISLIKQATAPTAVDQMVKDSLQAPEKRPSGSDLQLRAILEGEAELLNRIASIGDSVACAELQVREILESQAKILDKLASIGDTVARTPLPSAGATRRGWFRNALSG